MLFDEMKPIPILHPGSMSAVEGCRYFCRRRELCRKCFLGRTTDRARLRPGIASLQGRIVRVVHLPFGPSNIPQLRSFVALLLGCGELPLSTVDSTGHMEDRIGIFRTLGQLLWASAVGK